MTLGELNTFIVSQLDAPLGHGEAVATGRLLLEDCLGVTQTTLLTRPDRTVEPETEERFRKMVRRIAAGEPPQYVIGRARFMGMDLRVTPATLIPRPETAGLVDMIVDAANGRRNLKIIDLGTGSGCIAIALARALPYADVTAVDVSADALAVARDNAKSLNADINFIEADIMHMPPGLEDFDIIVSNPPYIAESERDSMEPRVKEHEPASALFVPDSDPLVFYRAIAGFASSTSPDASLYFEINPLFAKDLAKMLRDMGYDADIMRDTFGRERYAVARKS